MRFDEVDSTASAGLADAAEEQPRPQELFAALGERHSFVVEIHLHLLAGLYLDLLGQVDRLAVLVHPACAQRVAGVVAVERRSLVDPRFASLASQVIVEPDLGIAWDADLDGGQIATALVAWCIVVGAAAIGH